MMRGRQKKEKDKEKKDRRQAQEPAGRGAGRTSRYEPLAPVQEHDPDLVDELDEAATGWRQTTAKMAGLTKLATIGVWVLLLSGPAIGVFAVAAASSGTSSTPTKSTTTTGTPSSTGPAGFAELYLAAYLAAGEGTEDTLAPYYSGQVTLANRPDSRAATSMVTVSAQHIDGGYWAVTVAARVQAVDKNGKTSDQGLHYFRVGVQAAGTAEQGGTAKPGKSDGTQALYAATSLPAEVNAPAQASAGELGYGSENGVSANDPVTDTVSRFIAAYLTGQGELDRYVSPGFRVTPIVPAPYSGTLVTGMQDDRESTDDGTESAVPADGTRRRVLVTVSATAGGEDYTLNYALTLTTRDGRWEVAAFDSAPVLDPEQTGPATDPSAVPSADPNTPTDSPTATAGD